jgi:hypothetical protein
MSYLDDLNLSPNHSRPFVKLFLDLSGCENLPKKKIIVYTLQQGGVLWMNRGGYSIQMDVSEHGEGT